MIDHQTESGHILDGGPARVRAPGQSASSQRQIGQDCDLREGPRALRQDPDVILIGEMRDLETISMAICRPGTSSAPCTPTRSPPSTGSSTCSTDAQQQVRVQLHAQGVISQTLVPKVGGGRVREILVGTDGPLADPQGKSRSSST